MGVVCLCCSVLDLALWCWKAIDTAALHVVCCVQWLGVEVVPCCNIKWSNQLCCSYVAGCCRSGAVGLWRVVWSLLGPLPA